MVLTAKSCLCTDKIMTRKISSVSALLSFAMASNSAMSTDTSNKEVLLWT